MRYASINTHLGIEQSRRDDLESIFYNIIYFIKGSLPWQGIKIKNKEEKMKKIMEYKMSTLIENLCKGLPIEFVEIFNLIKKLKFEEAPNYKRIKQLIYKMINNNQKLQKNEFDWVNKLENPLNKISNEEEKNFETRNKLESYNKGTERNDKSNCEDSIRISQNKNEKSSTLFEINNSFFSLATPSNISNMAKMESSIIKKPELNPFEYANSTTAEISNHKLNDEHNRNHIKNLKKEDKKECCNCIVM